MPVGFKFATCILAPRRSIEDAPVETALHSDQQSLPDRRPRAMSTAHPRSCNEFIARSFVQAKCIFVSDGVAPTSVADPSLESTTCNHAHELVDKVQSRTAKACRAKARRRRKPQLAPFMPAMRPRNFGDVRRDWLVVGHDHDAWAHRAVAALELDSVPASVLRLGSICSGARASLFGLKAVARALGAKTGLQLRYQEVFDCEIAEHARTFIEMNCADSRGPGYTSFQDCLSTEFQHGAGECDIVDCGWVCVNNSSENRFSRKPQLVSRVDVEASAGPGVSTLTLRASLDHILFRQMRTELPPFQNL